MSIDTTAAIPSSVVYVTADPDRPPYDYIGRHRRAEAQAAPRPARRGKRWLAAGLAVVGITLTIACSGTATPDAPPLNDSPATHAAAPKGKPPAGYGDGQYRVGTQIAAGTYATTVPDGSFCLWNRVKDFTGNLGTIKGQGVLNERAHGQVTVLKSDYGVEFTGGCEWTKAAK